MPELGKYAEAVLSAYAVSLLLILALVAASLWKARKTKVDLTRVEEREKGRRNDA